MGERRPRPFRPPCTGEGEGRIEVHAPLLPQDPRALEQMKAATPAKVGVGRAGLRYRTETLLQFLADAAVAKAAVESQVPEGWALAQGYLPLQTACSGPEEFLSRPDLGRRLSQDSMTRVERELPREPDVQIVVGDGLSAAAVLENAPEMVRTLTDELVRMGVKVGRTVFVRHCRSKIVDLVGQAVGARVGVILVGERPGLGTGDGMSAYLVWEPRPERTDAEKQAISNVHRRGLPPHEAGLHAARIIQAILAQRTSGVNLDLSALPKPDRNEKKRANQANPDYALGCGQSHGQQCASARDGRPGQTCGRDDSRPCETCKIH